jgi:nucleoid-associated protein YgaU
MKKFLVALIALTCFAATGAFAVTSYDNNEYQRKSRELSAAAERSFDEGDYDAAVTYAAEAEENARLSAAFIEKMLAKASAEKAIYAARTRLSWAQGLKAEVHFPAAYAAAEGYLASADAKFSAEEFAGAERDANACLEELAAVREIIPLPEYYTVDLWDTAKDCFWNIAKNPAVYGDPLLWEKLYEANKSKLKRPGNPNLVMPGMVVRIPSIKGELREGMYDPYTPYEPFKEQYK